jgi:hypothetical protein
MKTRDIEVTTAPVEIPPYQTNQDRYVPEFIRLPPSGQLCPMSGMSRSALNGLILPSEANGGKPPVKSFCIRQRGARTGIRLISYPHLREFILAHAEGANDTEVQS